MKRRAFLTMLGLAPVVAHALPRPANPATLAKGGPVSKAKYIVGESCSESIVAKGKFKMTVDIDDDCKLRTALAPFVIALKQGEEIRLCNVITRANSSIHENH